MAPGDTLSLVLSTRIGTNPNDTKCAGSGSATGLRLYYDSTTRPSRFDATIGTDPSANLYLRSDGKACVNAPSTGVITRFLGWAAPTATAAKCKDSSTVKFVGGNPFATIGTWTRTLP